MPAPWRAAWGQQGMSATEVFERHAQEYDAWFKRNPAAYEAELRAIKAALPGSGAGLEIGVGRGRFAALLGIGMGIDPSLAMAAMARARGIEVIIARAEQLPFPAKQFDYALMVTTICFVDDLKAAFRETARVLKPGGILVIGFIDRNSLLGKQYAARKDQDGFYRHARFYSVGEVLSNIRQAGFADTILSQTIFDSSERGQTPQPVKAGHGEGSFVVLKATRKSSQAKVSSRGRNARKTHLP
jgi:SAM-dependent methyltransferase